MIETGLTTITWFILVSLFLPQAGIRLANHGLLNLVRAGPGLLNLVQAGRCLIKLVWNGRLIIDGHGSPYHWRPRLWHSSLVRNGRGRGLYGRGYGSGHVRCGRGPPQGIDDQNDGRSSLDQAKCAKSTHRGQHLQLW